MKDTDQVNGKGFARGAQVVLRPVLEQDLERLAYLLGECPVVANQDQLPWTTARLKKKFEDADKPGLWSDNRFMFTVARLGGEVIGFVDCIRDSNGGLWIAMHIGDHWPDRDVLGRDALAAFMAMARKWHNLPRVASALLDGEGEKQAWFEAAGFELEIRAAEAQLHLGQIRDILIYGWLAESTSANRAPAGIGVME